MTFYFTADGRVDFRQLVRELAGVFRTRIELRQIGVRDEAKMMGGMGCCGRPLCCATFLGDFVPVSIRMAKEQNLSLNPTKTSGICGRLMCCLKYENDGYGCGGCMKEKKEEYTPVQNDRVVAESGEGRVVALNEQRHMATILMDDGKTVVASWDDIAKADAAEGAGGCACPHRLQASAQHTLPKEQREPRERRSGAKHRRDRSERASDGNRRAQKPKRQPRRTPRPQHSDEVYE